VAEVTLHAGAEADYEEALAWYLDRSPQAADRFEAAVGEAIDAIAAHPTLFPRCDARHRYILLRRYPFSLVYRDDGDAVRVIAIAHSKRRRGYWSDRA
jgi:plasmid stabilization system protein ParE